MAWNTCILGKGMWNKEHHYLQSMYYFFPIEYLSFDNCIPCNTVLKSGMNCPVRSDFILCIVVNFFATDDEFKFLGRKLGKEDIMYNTQQNGSQIMVHLFDICSLM